MIAAYMDDGTLGLDGQHTEQVAKMLGVGRWTVWNDRKAILKSREDAMLAGEAPVEFEVMVSPNGYVQVPDPIAKEDLSLEAQCLTLDTPEAFQWWFNKCWPEVDFNVTEMAPHSYLFVEAAFKRCPLHPAVEGSWEDPAVRAFVKMTAACPECRWKDNVLLLVPPEHAKSAVFTEAMSAWRICQDADFQRVVISKSLQLAQQFVGRVAICLEAPVVTTLFGAFHTDAAEVIWRPATPALRVARSRLTRGVNILGRGLMTQISSLRATEVVCDDVIDIPRAKSETTRKEDSWVFHNVIESRVATGRMWVIGTRSHFDDLYGELEALRDDDGNPVWETIKFPAIDWETGETLWPTKFNVKVLSRMQAKIGTSAFSLTYQQDPLSGDDVLAKWEWFHGREDDPDPNRGCLDRDRLAGPDLLEAGWVRVASFDPSGGAGFAGFAVADVNPEMRNEVFEAKVLFLDRWKGGIAETVKHFEEYLGAFRPSHLIIEKNIAFEYLRSPELRALTDRLGVRVVPHQTAPYTKLDRIGAGAWALASDIEFHRIRLPYGDHESRLMSGLLMNEATTFPYGRTSDVLMALSFIKAELPMLRRVRKAERTNTGWGSRFANLKQPIRWGDKTREKVPA